MVTFKHFVLTVFNVRLSHGGAMAPDRAWLEHRFRLFEEFCFPSVQAQTSADFTWFVFFDTSTPDEFKRRIERFSVLRQFVPCYVSEVMGIESFSSMKASLIAPYLPFGATHVITSNLDNDDALHSHFVENVQKEFSGQEFEFLNFTNGFLYDQEQERLYVRKHHSNPFVSLIEKTEQARTVWCAPHPEMARLGRVRQLATEPMWLQVIHGRNVSNSIADARRVPLRRRMDGFAMLDSLPRREESFTAITLENASRTFSGLFSRFVKH